MLPRIPYTLNTKTSTERPQVSSLHAATRGEHEHQSDDEISSRKTRKTRKTRAYTRRSMLNAIGRGLRSPLSGLATLTRSRRTNTTLYDDDNNVSCQNIAEPSATSLEFRAEPISPSMDSDAMLPDDTSEYSTKLACVDPSIHSTYRLRGGSGEGDLSDEIPNEPSEPSSALKLCHRFLDDMHYWLLLDEATFRSAPDTQDLPAEQTNYTEFLRRVGPLGEWDDNVKHTFPPKPPFDITSTLWPYEMQRTMRIESQRNLALLQSQQNRLAYTLSQLEAGKDLLRREKHVVEDLQKCLDRLEAEARERTHGTNAQPRSFRSHHYHGNGDGWDDDNDDDGYMNGGERIRTGRATASGVWVPQNAEAGPSSLPVRGQTQRSHRPGATVLPPFNGGARTSTRDPRLSRNSRTGTESANIDAMRSFLHNTLPSQSNGHPSATTHSNFVAPRTPPSRGASRTLKRRHDESEDGADGEDELLRSPSKRVRMPSFPPPSSGLQYPQITPPARPRGPGPFDRPDKGKGRDIQNSTQHARSDFPAASAPAREEFGYSLPMSSIGLSGNGTAGPRNAGGRYWQETLNSGWVLGSTQTGVGRARMARMYSANERPQSTIERQPPRPREVIDLCSDSEAEVDQLEPSSPVVPQSPTSQAQQEQTLPTFLHPSNSVIPPSNSVFNLPRASRPLPGPTPLPYVPTEDGELSDYHDSPPPEAPGTQPPAQYPSWNTQPDDESNSFSWGGQAPYGSDSEQVFGPPGGSPEAQHFAARSPSPLEYMDRTPTELMYPLSEAEFKAQELIAAIELAAAQEAEVTEETGEALEVEENGSPQSRATPSPVVARVSVPGPSPSSLPPNPSAFHPSLRLSAPLSRAPSGTPATPVESAPREATPLPPPAPAAPATAAGPSSLTYPTGLPTPPRGPSPGPSRPRRTRDLVQETRNGRNPRRASTPQNPPSPGPLRTRHTRNARPAPRVPTPPLPPSPTPGPSNPRALKRATDRLVSISRDKFAIIDENVMREHGLGHKPGRLGEQFATGGYIGVNYARRPPVDEEDEEDVTAQGSQQEVQEVQQREQEASSSAEAEEQGLVEQGLAGAEEGEEEERETTENDTEEDGDEVEEEDSEEEEEGRDRPSTFVVRFA